MRAGFQLLLLKWSAMRLHLLDKTFPDKSADQILAAIGGKVLITFVRSVG